MAGAPRPPMMTLDDALQRVLERIIPLPQSETLPLQQCNARVLAQPVVSELHVPAHDNAAMDGYAVRCEDLREPGAVLQVTQRIPAGSYGAPLQRLSAARIFTGAPIPPNADAVVMQEDTVLVNECEGGVRFNGVVVPGQHIRRAGEDVARGAVVLPSGTRLGPAELGLAASVGCASLAVVRRPRVALFSTGNELVSPGEKAPAEMPPGAIYNSNRYFLYTLLQGLGCDVTDLGIVPDRLDATVLALQGAATAHDLILTSGGVSVGEEDHVKPAVEKLGALNLWQIAMKPGKPFAFGQVGNTHFMGLPGNPVSSLVTFLLLVRPALLKLQGVIDDAPKSIAACADFTWSGTEKRREFLRVRLNAAGHLELFPNQSSGVLTSAVWGDGLVDNPPLTPIAPGDTVRYFPFASLVH